MIFEEKGEKQNWKMFGKEKSAQIIKRKKSGDG
jgi:hypothetical protein